MMGKRYHYDADGNLKGYSSSTRKITLKDIFTAHIILSIFALMGLFNRETSNPVSSATAATPKVTDAGEDDDLSVAYVVTNRANLRYDTTTDTPVVGQLAPGDRIRGEPRIGADYRNWVMITDGSNSGSFVWAGNLRREKTASARQ